MYKKVKGITFLFASFVFCLMAIGINSGNAQAYEVSGFYQYETNSTGITITKYTGGELTVSIPNKIAGKNVTAIGRSAFENNDIIEHVNIPKTVTLIDYCAFSDCDSLLEIIIPDSVKVINSARWSETFASCDSLKNVVIGDGLEEIQANCFKECPKLQSVVIGKNVKKIADGAFYKCDGLTNMSIPGSVKSIGDSCFSECTNLKAINLSQGLETIGYSAFVNCDSLEKIIIPDSVKVINSGRWSETFAFCDNLKSVVIGGGLEEIQPHCFKECPKLQNVVIGKKVKKIQECAFSKCDSLTSIDIPGSVKYIGDACFSECINLQAVNLSYGLETIGYSAFNNCDSLREIRIPNSATTINSGRWNEAFGHCDNLSKLEIPNSVTTIGENLVNESGKVIIYGYANSMAEQYALTNKIPFQVLNSVPSESFAFINSELLVMAGARVVLDYTIKPNDTTDAIIWKSSDENIASVDNIGIVTTKNMGSVSIIATTTSGKRGSMTIIVQDAPKSISFKSPSKTFAIGQTYTQKAFLDGGSRTDVNITYTSSDDSIVSVSSSGKITAKKEGKVLITAQIFNGLKASYQVTVKKAPTSVRLIPAKITFKTKNTYTLKPVLSSGSYTSEYIYKSSNPNIVTVDSKGKIVAKKKGIVKIMVTTHNGKSASCMVIIK